MFAARGRCEDFVLGGFGRGMFAGGIAVNGVIVSRLGFRFREITGFRMDGFVFFLLGLLVGDLDFYIPRGVNFFGVLFRFFFGVIFFEFDAATERLCFGHRLGFFVLGLRQAGRKRYGFFVAQGSFDAGGFGGSIGLCRGCFSNCRRSVFGGSGEFFGAG